MTRKEQLDHQVSVADAAVVCTDPQKNPIPDGTVDDDVESCESNDYIAVVCILCDDQLTCCVKPMVSLTVTFGTCRMNAMILMRMSP